jgi:adenylate kinase
MSDPRYRTVLLFGAPGVGKGTQGKILGQLPGLFHISCGDVFRALDMRSPEGKEVYHYSSRGELAPDPLTIRIWKKGLDGQIALGRFKPEEDLLILDGIPRNVHQAEIIEDHLKVVQIVHLVCSDEEAMIDRIKRRAIHENRADDASDQIIRHRFEVYRDESAPVLGHYPQEMVCRIDSLPIPAEVTRNILNSLIPVIKRHFHTDARC